MDGSQLGTRPVYSREQISSFKAEGGKITAHRIGGGGGARFFPTSIRDLRLWSGSKIDAIEINGVRYGGGGGGVSDSSRLTRDRQIKDIGYAMHEGVLGSLTFYFTDDTRMSIGVEREETLLSSRLGCSSDDLRVIALGGWCGDFLDALDPVCVVGFSEASILNEHATAVIGAIPQGVTQTEYVENTAKRAESYEHALSQSHSVTTNASVTGTYYVTASIETEYTYNWTSQTTIAKSIEDQLTSAKTQEITPPEDAYAMFEITHGQIIAPGGDTSQSIFLPLGNVTSTYMPVNNETIDNLVGMYDLGGYCEMLPASKITGQHEEKTGLNVFAKPSPQSGP